MRSLTLIVMLLFPVAPAWAQGNNAPVPGDVSATSTARSDPDAVRCLRIQETGSRVRAQRICRTNAEWKRIADAGNQKASDMVDANRISTEQGN